MRSPRAASRSTRSSPRGHPLDDVAERDPRRGRAGGPQGARRCVSRAGERAPRTGATVSTPAVEMRQASGADRRADRARSGRPRRWAGASDGCSSGRTGAGRRPSSRSRALDGSPRRVASSVLGRRPWGRADVRAIHPKISHTSHVLAERMPPGLDGPDRRADRASERPSSPWFQEFDEADERRAASAARTGRLRASRRAALRHLQPGRAAAGAPRPRALLRPGAADPRRAGLGARPAGAGDA